MPQLFLIWLSLAAAAPIRSPSFAEFEQRARAGERLNVVFFGASLTWGANATDPLRTSYRVRIAERLEAKYPEARFKFCDAAIGGTGSQLGVFRIDRDVLARRPDLVFLDFLMSRWIDSATIAARPPAGKHRQAKAPEPFRARFRGSMVMFFGETTKTSGKYRVRIDGQTVRYQLPKSTQMLDLFDAGHFARLIGGNGHHAQVIATGLDQARTHTLEIEPVLGAGEELRLESICVAGKEAAVEPMR